MTMHKYLVACLHSNIPILSQDGVLVEWDDLPGSVVSIRPTERTAAKQVVQLSLPKDVLGHLPEPYLGPQTAFKTLAAYIAQKSSRHYDLSWFRGLIGHMTTAALRFNEVRKGKQPYLLRLPSPTDPILSCEVKTQRMTVDSVRRVVSWRELSIYDLANVGVELEAAKQPASWKKSYPPLPKSTWWDTNQVHLLLERLSATYRVLPASSSIQVAATLGVDKSTRFPVPRFNRNDLLNYILSTFRIEVSSRDMKTRQDYVDTVLTPLLNNLVKGIIADCLSEKMASAYNQISLKVKKVEDSES